MRIDTAVAGGAPWHVRVHRITTDRELVLSETGFALAWEPEGFDIPAPDDPDAGRASATSPWGASTIVDVVEGTVEPRHAAILSLSPNANMIHPHSLVPALTIGVQPGTFRLACVVGASHDATAVSWERAPDIATALFERLEAFAARPEEG